MSSSIMSWLVSSSFILLSSFYDQEETTKHRTIKKYPNLSVWGKTANQNLQIYNTQSGLLVVVYLTSLVDFYQ